MRELAGVFVVAGHLDGSFCAAELERAGVAGGYFACRRRLFCIGRGLRGAGVGEELQLGFGNVEGAEAGGAEEDYGVLNAFAAEAGEGLGVLGEDADLAAFGGVEEVLVLVGERRGGEMFWGNVFVIHGNHDSGLLRRCQSRCREGRCRR